MCGCVIEQLSLLATSSTTWKIIQKINLEPLLHQGERLLDAWRSITQHCSNMVACRHQQQLKNIYKQITDTNKDIDKALELLEGQGAPKANRIRRAWFSGVGRVSRYVFGTLDEAAEEEIKGLIEGAKDKTRQVSNLLRNQTEVVYKEFGAIQMKTEELDRKTQILDQHQQDSQKEAAMIVATQLLEENVLQYEIDVQTD